LGRAISGPALQTSTCHGETKALTHFPAVLVRTDVETSGSRHPVQKEHQPPDMTESQIQAIRTSHKKERND